MKYFVYILKSLKFKRYYVGFTQSLEARFNVHNSSRAKWTKRFQPWEIVHSEKFQNRSDALKRERFLKRLKGIERKLVGIKAGRL